MSEKIGQRRLISSLTNIFFEDECLLCPTFSDMKMFSFGLAFVLKAVHYFENTLQSLTEIILS